MILIGADFVPTETNKKLFCDGNAEELFGEELNRLLIEADFRIFNLEMPITDVKSPIDKCGPCLSADTDTIKLYKTVNVDLVTLANNHIMDQGETGLFSTLDILDKEQIAHVGAGMTSDEAACPFSFFYKGKKICVYACAEHEFSIVEARKAGANPFDMLESFDQVQQIKKECDFLVVLYHGGKENYRYPSPNLQRYCRKFIEKGADLVICQHSHCIGCLENYNEGTIIYGQGNFLFDYGDDECFETGLLIGLDDDLKLCYYPIIKQGSKARLADEIRREEIIEGFYLRSKEITEPYFVEKKYSEKSTDLIDQYLSHCLGKVSASILFRGIRKLAEKRLASKMYNKSQLLILLNDIECEAHREMFIEGLKGKTK